MGYKKPKKYLHREFLYLNSETIINSLSALEAGKIDEIIQKANEAREGGFGASVGVGPVEATGGKKKSSTIEEEMVRTRTVFSAFDAWYRYLLEADAIGSFDAWSQDVRDELSVGDTIQFEGRITLTPLHLVFRTFISFAQQAERADSVFHQTGAELNETRKYARMMKEMLGGKDAPQHLPVYLEPFEVDEPRLIARLDEEHLLSPREGVNGVYKVIAQVEEILREGDEISAIRIVRDVPPTPVEITTTAEALTNVIEPATALGVTLSPEDISLPYPAVLVRPIAIYR